MFSPRLFQKVLPQEPLFVPRVVTSENMAGILEQVSQGSVLVLDIDDTLGRLPQSIGLDPWFRFRLDQYASEGHDFDQALLQTIAIYNPVQQASPRMVPVDKEIEIGFLMKQLQAKGVKVIGLTARNSALIDVTLQQLDSIGVSFCQDLLMPTEFELKGKKVQINAGIVFSDGSHKGDCFTAVQPYFKQDHTKFNQFTFVDDRAENCERVVKTFDDQGLNSKVWHYNYAETHLPFLPKHKQLSTVQEMHFRQEGIILSDEEAESHSKLAP